MCYPSLSRQEIYLQVSFACGGYPGQRIEKYGKKSDDRPDGHFVP